MPPHTLVTDERALARVVESLSAVDRYAVDTEFHRERTYYPHVALVQLAWDGDIALVDPLAVDLGPLCAILQGGATAVMHAAGQDLEVLARACGAVPSTLFDTQLAAGFLGYATPALGTLVERELGIRLPKGDRLTDWLRRPLGPDQLDYAASDVAHLLDLCERLRESLDAVGRLTWAEDECEQLRTRARTGVDPASAWMRIKDSKHLRGRSRGVAQAVAAWRERTAAAVDQPARFVLPDLALLGIAQRPPRSTDDLRRVRGLDDRHLRGGAAREILAAVEEGLSGPAARVAEPRDADLDRELRPAVTLVSAWISQMARDLRLDTSLLATRADLVALLQGHPDARLSAGWRQEMVGEPIRRLVEGRAALAFDGDGGLVLEERSRRGLERG